VNFTGAVRPARKGVQIERQRYLASAWTTMGSTTTAANGSWSVKVLTSTAGTYIYRVRALAGGKVIAQTHARTIVVSKPTGKATIDLKLPPSGKVGKPLLLSGTVKGAPPGATVQRQRLINGVWQTLGSTNANAVGTWAMSVTPPKAANYTYRVALVVSGKVVAVSKVITVKVVA
jgi:hypothetical protein